MELWFSFFVELISFAITASRRYLIENNSNYQKSLAQSI